MARKASVWGRPAGKLAGMKALAAAVTAASTPGGASLAQRLTAVPRLAKAVASGRYRGLTTTQLALLTAAAAYIASPVDLVPESLLGVIGLADDAVVLTWFATHLVKATDDFLAWEGSTGVTLEGERLR